MTVFAKISWNLAGRHGVVHENNIPGHSCISQFFGEATSSHSSVDCSRSVFHSPNGGSAKKAINAACPANLHRTEVARKLVASDISGELKMRGPGKLVSGNAMLAIACRRTERVFDGNELSLRITIAAFCNRIERAVEKKKIKDSASQEPVCRGSFIQLQV